MSRIFDALRRVEQMKNPVAVETLPDAAPEGADVCKSFSLKVEDLEKVERVTFRPKAESRLLGKSERDRPGLERFKLLRYRLYRLRQQRAMKSILVTSAIPKEGKSTVAANLAVSLAQASERVLLIDADLRRPDLHNILGLRPSEGLAELLQGRAELLSLSRRVESIEVYFLAAGQAPANPVELLQGESMSSVVKTAESMFDWVVIDSPPVLPLADARFVASLCDGVIVVAREEHTRREELREGLAALKGAFMAGIVLNSSREASMSAFSYYYQSESTEQTGVRRAVPADR